MFKLAGPNERYTSFLADLQPATAGSAVIAVIATPIQAPDAVPSGPGKSLYRPSA
jgi:hypothetical protein